MPWQVCTFFLWHIRFLNRFRLVRTNSFIILVIAMVAFVIIGAGLIIFGLGRSYKISKEELEERKRLENEKKEQ